jgi:diguanylate cyclase (GGDEF)-like protein/PAS domain S-box-containing protein
MAPNLNLDALSAKLPELLLDPVVVVDETGRFVFVNAAFERVLGYAKAELIGKPIFDLVHPEDRERTRAAAEQVMQTGSHVNFENRYLHKDGRVVNMMWSARWSETDRLRIAVARDVTALKRSEAARAALYRISEAALSADSLPALCGVIHNVIDELLPAGNFYVALLDEASGNLSYPYPESRSEPARPSEPLLPGTALEHVIRSGEPLLTAREGFLESNGSRQDPVSGNDWLGVPLVAGERVTGAVVVETRTSDKRYTADDRDLLQFVSTQIATAIERTQIRDRLRHMAHHDELTGLPNRLLFYDRFDMALNRACRDKELVGLLYLDLNDFKEVNDTRGHHAGDLVLQQVARRLEGCVRQSDTVARMGGDEFTVLLINIADRHAAEATRERILEAMAELFDLGDAEAGLSVSVGLATYPEDGDDVEQLLRRADAGMYGTKR